jgi:hypothetical protein
MNVRKFSLLGAALLVLFVLLARAGEPKRRPKRQNEFAAATLVAQGKVTGLIFQDDGTNETPADARFLLEMVVSQIDKGKGPKPGNLLWARGWGKSTKTRGSKAQSYLPRKGEPIRAFLRRGKNGYELLYPRGIETLRTSKK